MAKQNKAAENAEKELQKKLAAENVEKKSGYKVRTDLGFEKRIYNVEGRNIVLEAGKEISKEDAKLFNSSLLEKFFVKK